MYLFRDQLVLLEILVHVVLWGPKDLKDKRDSEEPEEALEKLEILDQMDSPDLRYAIKRPAVSE